jgi:hypothetical protein
MPQDAEEPEMNKSLHIGHASWIIALAVSLMAFLDTNNLGLWAMVSVSLPLAVTVAGSWRAPPVVILNLGLFWAAIYCSILSIYLTGGGLELSDNEYYAIIYSLIALLCIAAGFRFGWRSLAKLPKVDDEPKVNLHKAFIAYVLALVFNSVLSIIGGASPALLQPITAFAAIKLVALYILVYQCLLQRSSYIYVLLAVVFELGVGGTSYIATYQSAFLVILSAALNWAGGRFSVSKVIVAGTFFGVFLWTSLTWTAVKPEFRAWMADAAGQDLTERIDWMTTRLSQGIDYNAAAVKFADRIGYTKFYSLAMPRLHDGLQHSIYWLAAIENVVMPRVLFPDKVSLDDTKITMELTGVAFSKETSVSVGYVAEAHADFGVPGMFIEMLLIGWGMAWLAKYLGAADISQSGQQALVSAALAYKFYYQFNIDKAFSTFTLQAIALALFAKFGYRVFERWLIAPFSRVPGAQKIARLNRGI